MKIKKIRIKKKKKERKVDGPDKWDVIVNGPFVSKFEKDDVFIEKTLVLMD